MNQTHQNATSNLVPLAAFFENQINIRVSNFTALRSKDFVSSKSHGVQQLVFRHFLFLVLEAALLDNHRIQLQLLLSTLDDLHFQSRSEEHTSELQSLMRISYAVFCLKKKRYL